MAEGKDNGLPESQDVYRSFRRWIAIAHIAAVTTPVTLIISAVVHFYGYPSAVVLFFLFLFVFGLSLPPSVVIWYLYRRLYKRSNIGAKPGIIGLTAPTLVAFWVIGNPVEELGNEFAYVNSLTYIGVLTGLSLVSSWGILLLNYRNRETPESSSSQTGCGCARCTTAKYDTERRNTVDSMLWSGGLFRRYPTAAVPFVVLVVLESVFRWDSFPGSGAVLLVFLTSARGYVDLCAVDDLLNSDRGAFGRMWTVLRRLPAAIIARGLSVIAILLPFVPLGIGSVVVPSTFNLLEVPVLTLVLAALSFLISLAGAFVVYVKMVLVSEACFVGGAGAVGSLRESWRSVKLSRAKVVLLAGTFSVIIGFLLSGVVGLGESGGDGESFLRIASSAATTAFYAGLFTHLYVERCFEREMPVHTPSGGSTSTPS